MKRKTGFTLIELLVVVAIIAVLISILLPALATARDAARSAVCKQQFHQVAIGSQGYLADYRDFLPPYADYGPSPTSTTLYGTTYTEFRRMHLHTEWFKSGSFAGGPRDGDGFLGPYMATHKDTLQGLIGCPSVKDGDFKVGKWMGGPAVGYTWHYRSFALNVYSVTTYGKSNQNTSEAIPFSTVPTPSRRAYFCDGTGVHSAYVIVPGVVNPYLKVSDYSILIPDPRHGNQSFNVLFLDGHVESGTWATHFIKAYFPKNHDDP